MRVQSIALPLALCVASALHAQTKVPGWTYAVNITYDSGTGPSNRGSIAIRYRTTATAMRQEMLQVSGTANRVTGGADIEGMYTLMNDVDSTYTTVMPGQHSAMVMANPLSMFEGREMPSVSANTTSQSSEDLGPGEKILGHATHHYRSRTTGTMTIKMGDEICTRPTDAESEVWIAPDLDILPAMRSMLAHYGSALPDSVPGKRKGSSPKSGLPLRTKIRTMAVLPNGERRVIETTTEYVELSDAPLDASLFTIPADYHVMDMRKEMAGMMSDAATSAKTNEAIRARMCPD